MTEPEWNTSTDPQAMLEALRASGKASERKLRLFAVACCRSIWHLLPDRRSRKALVASERFADGLIPSEKLNFVRGDSRWAANGATRNSDDSEGVKWIAAHLTEQDVNRVLFAVCPAAYLGGRETQHPIQCALLRDIFGNPFCHMTIAPAWLVCSNGTVAKLATVIYEERELPSGHLDKGHLGVLADALEDAGCHDERILGHCRGPAEHARGCWVVDLLLRKG